MGLWTVFAGADSVPLPRDAAPNVESELRYYSAWYVGAGLVLFWLSRHVREHPAVLRGFCAILFLGGCSRLLAARATDWPSTSLVVLMTLELTLPVILLAWHARASRSS